MTEANPTETYFTRMAGVLDQLEMPTLILPVTEENQIEALLVSLDDPPPTEENPARFVAQLFFASDAVTAAYEQSGGPEPEEGETAILQFALALGLNCPETRHLDIYRLMSIYNRILPVGALDLNEENELYVRYGLLADTKNAITIPQVVEVLEIFSFFIPIMADGLEDVIAGEATLEEAIAATERELIKSAQMP